MVHEHGDRLIYAVDKNFDAARGLEEVYSESRQILDNACLHLGDLGITIKANTLLRTTGIPGILSIEESGCGLFGDYKLFDVQGTIANDASWLHLAKCLKILTVSEHVHPKVFQDLNETLKDAIIAPVNPLTDLTDVEFLYRNEISRKFATNSFFRRVAELPAKGVICAASDIANLSEDFRNDHIIITPAIRPTFVFLKNDTNAVNAMTPRKAILAGADKLVVGSPLRFKNQLRDNALYILDEIGEALVERNGK